HKVIASSDAQSHLGQNVDLKLKAGQASGYSAQANNVIQGYSMTPGFETYPGMGWLGVIEQQLPAIEG
ncbi:chemotaxis protein, partial [Pseudomonas quasicaspiana]|nr:chemotaxis protein [Pseudomonas quasicaspiana]